MLYSVAITTIQNIVTEKTKVIQDLEGRRLTSKLIFHISALCLLSFISWHVELHYLGYSRVFV